MVCIGRADEEGAALVINVSEIVISNELEMLVICETCLKPQNDSSLSMLLTFFLFTRLPSFHVMGVEVVNVSLLALDSNV